MSEVPLHITFKDFESSEAASFLMRERADRLGELFDRITTCQVFVTRPEHRSQQKIFNIRIHLVIPGKEFESNRDTRGEAEVHSDIRVAIEDAFDHIERELLSYLQRRRTANRHASRVIASQ